MAVLQTLSWRYGPLNKTSYLRLHLIRFVLVNCDSGPVPGFGEPGTYHQPFASASLPVHPFPHSLAGASHLPPVLTAPCTSSSPFPVRAGQYGQLEVPPSWLPETLPSLCITCTPSLVALGNMFSQELRWNQQSVCKQKGKGSFQLP